MTMRWKRCALSTVLGLITSACFGLFEPEPRADGEMCDGDDQCQSARCVGGMCTGSSCDVDSQCEAGFSCAEPGTLAEVFSLGLATGSCVPMCSVCPTDEPRWSCSGDACFYDDTPTVEAGGPYQAVVGQSVRVVGSAELADGRELMSATWSTWEQGELGQGLEADVVFTVPGSHTVTLDVVDDEYASGSATAAVTVCSPEQGPCGDDRDCCDAQQACLFDDDPYNGHCGPPPVCGDGVREGDETCDGTDTPPMDCADLGQFHPGPVPCSQSCTPDTDACVRCGESFDDCVDDASCCAGYVCEYGQCRSA